MIRLGFDAAQGSNIAYEAGRYEYDPTAIASQDTIVLVDKPEPQIGTVQTANFNVQYETVGLQLLCLDMSSIIPPCSKLDAVCQSAHQHCTDSAQVAQST